jgi:hypothetical protein
LAGVYKRADKELAHFTDEDKYNDEFNTDKKLIEAAESIEFLLKKFLYGNKNIQLPFPELNENFYY